MPERDVSWRENMQRSERLSDLSTEPLSQATFAGGCFWCLEAPFSMMPGVRSVESGYIGGATPNPSYEAVCTGLTGHAEVIRITFDPTQVSFGELLQVFFALHDPTTLNRQGHDIGTQYRSAIFYHSEAQRIEAEATIRALEQAGTWASPVVTQLEPASEFYPAEDYHQGYFARHPEKAYCMAVIAPKVTKMRAMLAERLKSGG